MAPVDLEEILHDVARIVRAEAEHQRITIHLDVQASLPPHSPDTTATETTHISSQTHRF